VPKHSAIVPGYMPIGIRSNHMDMAKFEDANDPGFAVVTGELRRWIKHLAALNGTTTLGASIAQPSQAKQQQDSAQCT
jgi:hypothetical protein